MAKLSLFGGVLIAIFAIVESSQLLTMLSAGLMLAGVEIVLITGVAGGFTPAIIPVPVINGVLLSSLFLWDLVDDEARYGIMLRVSEDLQVRATLIGIVFCAAYTLGVVAAGPRSMNVSLSEMSASIAQIGRALPIPDGTLVAVGYAGIFVAIYAFQGALLEGRYLQTDGPEWAVLLSTAFTPLSMLAFAIVAVRPGPWRVAALFGIAAWLLILFARSTRTIATLPAMILLAAMITSGRKIRLLPVALAAGATVLLLQLVIFGRGNPDGVGIIPLSSALFTQPDEFLGNVSLYGALGNIWISGPLTAVVAQRAIPPEALWISVNPLPGGMAGWHEIYSSLRLNLYTPYNSLGELGAHGWVALVLVAGAAGIAISVSTRVAASLSGAYAMSAMVLVVATVALFSVTLLQYNLRSAIRLIWYTLIGVTTIWLVQGFFTRPTTQVGVLGRQSDRQKFLGPVG